MFQRDFKEFIELLNNYAVEYLLVGGYALAIYGCSSKLMYQARTDTA